MPPRKLLMPGSLGCPQQLKPNQQHHGSCVEGKQELLSHLNKCTPGKLQRAPGREDRATTHAAPEAAALASRRQPFVPADLIACRSVSLDAKLRRTKTHTPDRQ